MNERNVEGGQLLAELMDLPEKQFAELFPGETPVTAYQHIRLTYLTPELLGRVDAGEIDVATAAVLSYMSPRNQGALEWWLASHPELKIGQTQAAVLRQTDDAGEVLTAEILRTLLAGGEQ